MIWNLKQNKENQYLQMTFFHFLFVSNEQFIQDDSSLVGIFFTSKKYVQKYIPRRRPVNCKKVPKNSIALSSNFSTIIQIKRRERKKKFGTIKKDFFLKKEIRKDICTTGPSFNFVFKTKSFINTQVFRFIQSRAYQQK